VPECAGRRTAPSLPTGPHRAIVSSHMISRRAFLGGSAALLAAPLAAEAQTGKVPRVGVLSPARPGGNTTGIANLVRELDGKRLALLKELLPQLTRVGVLASPGDTRYKEHVTELRSSARSLSLQVHVFEVTRPAEIEGTFAAIDKARVEAVLVLAGIRVLEPNRAQIVAMASKHRRPSMYSWNFYTEIGGLMSYSANLSELHHRSAGYVDRILKGAKPADLPVEQPTKFELIINLKTAKALGLTIPPSLLLRADQAIE